jgi:hypothetical protein
MGRFAVSSSSLPRPVVHASISLLTKTVPMATVEAVLQEQGKASQRLRLLPASFLVYYVIALSFFMSYPLREVLRCLLDGFRAVTGDRRAVLIAVKGSITDARVRLGWEVMRQLFLRVAHPLATRKTRGAWYRDWRLVAIDGTSFSLQHTAANATEFGLHESKEGPSAFPLLRMVALVEIGTHAVIAAACDAYRKAELALAEELLPRLSAEMLLLEDRGFVGYAWWAKTRRANAEILCRLLSNMKFNRDQPLADGSYLSTIRPPKGVAGEPIPVRIIVYCLKGVPNAEPQCRLVTSLLDPTAAPAEELAALYHERWEEENTFDEFKTHLRGGSHVLLRSKTPDLVRQEFYGLLLAHYIVQAVKHDAALAIGEDPDRLSFTHTIRVLKRRLPKSPGAFSPSEVRESISGAD